MTKKKVAFGTNPRGDKKPLDVDTFVEKGIISDKPKTTRFTIDIPSDLHARIKSFCALKGVKMKEEIHALLEGHFKKT